MFITAHQHFQARWVATDVRMAAARQRSISLVEADVYALAERLPIILPATPDALPQALVVPKDTDMPFGEHTPRLWENYPFSLIPESLGVDDNGEPTTHDMLWMDPLAPQPTHPLDGYRLFDQDSQPSEALRGVMQRLRRVQGEVVQTQAMIRLLHDAKALTARKLEHYGESLRVYEVSTEGLDETMDKSHLELAYKAATMAEAIQQSQQSLSFEPDEWAQTQASS